MTSIISQRELRNDSADIMRRLDDGETFIVTRNGHPVGQLIPLRKHRVVGVGALLEAFEGAPTIDTERFRADLEESVDDSLFWDE